MSEPEPTTLIPATGHVVYILFTGSGQMKSSLNDYGYIFDTEVGDDDVHCMLVDPRFALEDILDYIVELGGMVYTYPPLPPPTF